MLPIPTFHEELPLWLKGYHVIGVDEVGRGAFAGPLIVGAVVFRPHSQKNVSLLSKSLAGVTDSKLLSEKKRNELVETITTFALTVKIAEVPVSIINKFGIGKANQIGFRRAIQKIQKELSGKKLYVLVDGFHAKYVRGIGLANQKALVKGDQKSFSIAGASIIAKVHRDVLMKKLDTAFGEYNFSQHKGYGTLEHRTLIKQFGLCKEHRIAFCH